MPHLRFPFIASYIVLAIAALAQAFSLALPTSILGWQAGQPVGFMQIVALAVALVVLVHGSTTSGQPKAFRVLFVRSWWFATVWLIGVFWWLFISMHQYGNLPMPLAALAVVLLAAALAIYYAVALAIWLWLRPRLNRYVQVLLFAALWLLAELCRGVLFTGFPWGAIGYAHIDTSLSLLAPWLGVYGIGWLASVCAAMLAVLWLHMWHARCLKSRIGFVLWLQCFLFLSIYNPNTTTLPSPSNKPISVALLQGNIAQDKKFQKNSIQFALDWYAQQISKAQADLVVLPETALPLPPTYLPEGYWQTLHEQIQYKPQTVLLGVPVGNDSTGYINAAVGISAQGAQVVGAGQQPNMVLPTSQTPAYQYAKHHLVPFGEFIPTGFAWFVHMMRIPLGDFQRGAQVQPRLLVHGQRIQPNICYEDLFGEELAASFINPQTAPTIMVNMSNIAWFGDSVAIDQHRHISRMRTIELARPMLRATNTGATAVIDANGQVQQELPRLSRGVLQAKIAGVDNGAVTFFAYWAARYGLLPLWIFGFVCAGAISGFALRKTPHLPVE